MSCFDKIIKFIYLAIVVAHLFIPASAQSDGVPLNMDADLTGWEAYLAYGAYNLSNDYKTNMLSKYTDRVHIFSPVFAKDLDWYTLIGLDWHAFIFEEIEDTLGFYPNKDQLTLTQTHDENFDSALFSSQYLFSDFGLSIEKWDNFIYNFDSGPVENTIPMPATILLICFGLIGLAGFARKRTNV